MEGACSCYRGGHFNEENDHVNVVASLEGGRMVILRLSL